MQESKTKVRIKTFFQYTELIKQLIVKDLKLKYRRSILGYLWSILNPLLVMLVMVIVFSNLLNRGGKIEHYAVYLLSGRIIYEFVIGSSSDAMRSILGNSALLKKIYLPKYIFPIAKVSSGIVNMVFSMGALLIVMVVTRTPFSWHFLLFPIVVVQVFLFTCGLGFFLAQAKVFFRDIQYIYHAFTTMWMYCTPIFYTIEQMHGKVRFVIEHLNPLYYYIYQFRCVIYYGRVPELSIVGMGFLIAIISFVLGLLCFKKTQDKFILYI